MSIYQDIDTGEIHLQHYNIISPMLIKYLVDIFYEIFVTFNFLILLSIKLFYS